MKQKRNDKRNILEYLKKLKAKAETIYEEENGDERNYFLIGFLFIFILLTGIISNETIIIEIQKIIKILKKYTHK